MQKKLRENIRKVDELRIVKHRHGQYCEQMFEKLYVLETSTSLKGTIWNNKFFETII